MKDIHPGRKERNKQLPLTAKETVYAKEFLSFLKSAGVSKNEVQSLAVLPIILINYNYGNTDD